MARVSFPVPFDHVTTFSKCESRVGEILRCMSQVHVLHKLHLFNSSIRYQSKQSVLSVQVYMTRNQKNEPKNVVVWVEAGLSRFSKFSNQ